MARSLLADVLVSGLNPSVRRFSGSLYFQAVESQAVVMFRGKANSLRNKHRLSAF